MRDFFRLAFNNLKRRKLRSWLTMLGIFIGIASVVALISLGQGLQTAVMGQFETLSTDKLTVSNAETGFGAPGSTAIKKLTDHDVKIIESIDGVEVVVPKLIRVGKGEYNKIAQFDYLTNVPNEEKKLKTMYSSANLKEDSGRLLKTSDSGKIMIGASIADKNTNGFDKDLKVGSRIKIQDKSFEVVGVLEKSSSFQMNLVIFMPEKEMKDLLEIGDEYDTIVAQIKSGYDIEKVAENIKTKMRKDRDLKKGDEDDFSVQTPVQALSTVNTILTIINVIVIGIASIALVVGGIGIANTMYTSVLERMKEIGTMKAIGARNSDVLTLFLLESGLLGLVGGLIGATLGLLIAFGVSGIANAAFGSVILKLNINYFLLLGAVFFSFFVGVSSGLLPALQAAKLRPVEALRG